MPTLRQVKKRIRSVINTRQITKAMEMVAAAKLRKAQMRIMQVRPYSEKLSTILSHLSEAASGELAHPFFEKREVKKRTLVLMTSDRGFCGSFNSNLIRRANNWLSDKNEMDVELVLVGKKGLEFYKRRPWNIVESFIDWSGNLDYTKARNLVDLLTGHFLDGVTDEISVIYTQFLSTARYKIVEVPYLPVESLEEEQKAEE